mmetsp:Transcript_144784/g.464027  ORF Transcript_144784/g.464027 Transcript_144784/m.464027 type:complete len:205 (+) Transcript_144784:1589-2203(+)
MRGKCGKQNGGIRVVSMTWYLKGMVTQGPLGSVAASNSIVGRPPTPVMTAKSPYEDAPRLKGFNREDGTGSGTPRPAAKGQALPATTSTPANTSGQLRAHPTNATGQSSSDAYTSAAAPHVSSLWQLVLCTVHSAASPAKKTAAPVATACSSALASNGGPATGALYPGAGMRSASSRRQNPSTTVRRLKGPKLPASAIPACRKA